MREIVMPERTGFTFSKNETGARSQRAGYSQFATYSHTGSHSGTVPNFPSSILSDQTSADDEKISLRSGRLRQVIRSLKADAASKVNEGLTPAVVLILLTILYDLIEIPVVTAFKLHGLLIFVLLIVTLGAIALDRSIQNRYSHRERVFQGMLAGMFFWFSANTAGRLQPGESAFQTNVIYMLLAAMVVVTLWRTVLPAGAKYFALVFLLNWIGRFVIARQLIMIQNWNFPAAIQWTYAWIALICMFLLVIWLFFGSRRQSQRSWAAVGIWFCGMEAISLFLGWPL